MIAFLKNLFMACHDESMTPVRTRLTSADLYEVWVNSGAIVRR